MEQLESILLNHGLGKKGKSISYTEPNIPFLKAGPQTITSGIYTTVWETTNKSGILDSVSMSSTARKTYQKIRVTIDNERSFIISAADTANGVTGCGFKGDTSAPDNQYGIEYGHKIKFKQSVKIEVFQNTGVSLEVNYGIFARLYENVKTWIKPENYYMQEGLLLNKNIGEHTILNVTGKGRIGRIALGSDGGNRGFDIKIICDGATYIIGITGTVKDTAHAAQRILRYEESTPSRVGGRVGQTIEQINEIWFADSLTVIINNRIGTKHFTYVIQYSTEV